ncbi:MAG TPA: hypothetical protein VJB94_03075 [Candidatus Nanoarchaeia archaeon]|nr:hypothetical protein [Candidatus Nanoarchaeia archaeon]
MIESEMVKWIIFVGLLVVLIYILLAVKGVFPNYFEKLSNYWRP